MHRAPFRACRRRTEDAVSHNVRKARRMLKVFFLVVIISAAVLVGCANHQGVLMASKKGTLPAQC